MENNSDFIQILLEKIEKDDLPTNVFDVEGTDPLVLLGKMNEIIGQLENFQSSVNTSNTTANEALSKAEDAVDTSGQALSNANTALSTANQAIGTANKAIETANQSLETAQDARDVAGQALSKSNTALNTANTAIDTANTALGTANTALSTSQSANATSSQALDTANNANATANSALESAGTANTTAETAKNIAETANQNSNQAVTTANEAKGIAETANQNSGQAVTTANEAKSTAENALEQVTQSLGTKVYDNFGNLLNETTFTGSNGINVDMDATSHKNFVISIDQTVTDKISQNETDISELQSANETQDTSIAQIKDDVDNLDNIVKSKVQEITLTGTTAGTITAEQLTTLQADDSNFIILNDEIYRLADKADTSGYRMYTHTAQHNPNVVTKSLRITISTLKWNVETRNIVDGESNQSIDGKKTFQNITQFMNEVWTFPKSQGNRIDIISTGQNFIKYGNGILICWGTAPAPSSNSWVEVNFPKPFIDTNYGIGASLKQPNNFSWGSDMLSFDNKKTTGVRFAVWNKREIQYIAIGYWK